MSTPSPQGAMAEGPAPRACRTFSAPGVAPGLPVAYSGRMIEADSKQVFSNRQDAIGQDIGPALGEFAGGYDLDKIFNHVYQYDEREAGFVQCVTVEEFWEIVEECSVNA